MTHMRQYADSEGDFGGWQETDRTCDYVVEKPLQPATVFGPTVPLRCGAKVRYRTWESSDGAYEDYQYRCENGHIFWIDGDDG